MERQVDPLTALDRFFQIVREEAIANPRFGRRLNEAIGYTVVYRGDEAAAAIDPILVAMRGMEEFRKTFLSMPHAQVKKIGEASGLLPRGKGTKSPKTPGELVDLLWNRATQRLDDLVPGRRYAAE